MDERKQLSAIERIILAAGQINYMANKLQMISSSFAAMGSEAVKEASEDINQLLEEIGTEMLCSLNKLSDCLNNLDAVDELDELVSNNILEELNGNSNASH